MVANFDKVDLSHEFIALLVSSSLSLRIVPPDGDIRIVSR